MKMAVMRRAMTDTLKRMNMIRWGSRNHGLRDRRSQMEAMFRPQFRNWNRWGRSILDKPRRSSLRQGRDRKEST